MKKTSVKRFVIMILVFMTVFAVYSPQTFCASPSPSPTNSMSPGSSPSGSASTSPSATDAASVSPTDTESEEASPSPSVSGFQMLMQNSKGAEVIRVQMRLRELGYFIYRATGNYFNATITAVTDFQKNNGLSSDGRVGEMTYSKLFTTSGLVRKKASPSAIVSGKQSDTATYTGELGDWATINAAFAADSTTSYKVTDSITGDSFNVVRTGGTNLAEVETATADDYTMFKKCFGGKTTWEKRGVVVTINGTNYAASLFGNPNGTDKLADNGMTGHTTLYFNGSTSDVLGFVDKEDWKEVLFAAGKPTNIQIG
jgi:peptidoglycan hydrolase-like protein with peptidoglycan-binding domain